MTSFIWYDLMTADIDRAAAFYGDVVGWTIAPIPGAPAGTDYRILTAPDGEGIGGLMPMIDDSDRPRRWLAYVVVADVDAMLAEVWGAGGTVVSPAVTAEGVGRMAIAADPQGNALYVMTPYGDGESHAFRSSDDATPGHAVWNELTTPDPDAAIAWYGDRFGWRQEGAMPMGDLGDYRFLLSGSVAIGAVMGDMPGGERGWLPYFLVEEIDAAAKRIVAGGGAVLHGPAEIPGGSFSLVAQDPDGVRFGLVGPREDNIDQD